MIFDKRSSWVSDHTVGIFLQRSGLPLAPERKHTTTRAAFFQAHLSVLAGADFFTAEILTLIWVNGDPGVFGPYGIRRPHEDVQADEED
jgi:hypothetical protein